MMNIFKELLCGKNGVDHVDFKGEVLSGSLPKSVNNNVSAMNTMEFDKFYMAFEDKFRGSPEEIRKRLEVYLPVIQEVPSIGSKGIQVLDLACGRGEWLGLIKDNGFTGRGVDINRVALARCREQGFDVVESDVLAYLISQGKDSFMTVTGFHLVEHLPVDALLGILHEAFRVLSPGGVLILETPDPDNVMVSTRNFFLDPTHRNPLPDETLVFIAEYFGFINVKILKLQKVSNPPLTDNAHLNEVLNRFFASQDYGMIAYKPL